MESNLDLDLIKRSKRVSNFYLSAIGQILKKRRKDLKKTQANVCSKIISDTALSKFENNLISLDDEVIRLICERMDYDYDLLPFPEDMIKYLEKSINLFFYKDIEEYEKLLDDLNKYDFSGLIQLVRLGYYILKDNYTLARPIYNEIFRYLNSLEDFGFSVFIVYAGFYNIGVKNYRTGRIILDKATKYFQNNAMIYGLYSYARFVIYGNLYLNMAACESGNFALNIFNQYANMVRINEMFIWKEIFLVYEGISNQKQFSQLNLDLLSANDRNYYLIAISNMVDNPIEYLDKLDESGENYLLGLFLKARYYLSVEDLIEYKKVYEDIKSMHYEKESMIDYANLLKLIKNKDDFILKDYLVNYALFQAVEKQNIYFMKIITEEIVRILNEKSRYKEAITHLNKLKSLVHKFQFDTELK